MHDFLFDDEEELKLPAKEMFEGTALDYLQGIYQGKLRFDAHRFRAANAALPFESPKLAVAAVIHPDGSFAERLERAISRSSNGNSHQPKLINHQPAPHSAEELKPTPTPTPAPKPKPNHFIAGRLMRRRIK